jgi:hypothetical protein
VKPLPTYAARLNMWPDTFNVETDPTNVHITSVDGDRLASELLGAAALLYCHGDEDAAREWCRTALRANCEQREEE